ncbi:MAG: aromatic ring-hydroxylating dioxygenase subunit alpha [Kiloniellales bacterium]|nr:aromatic ring-hydroxylating dioxygenase subunit alpha [Kiloniellales bacterium]
MEDLRNEGAFQELMSRQSSDRPLEQPFYGDPAIYERERERIFLNHWHFVGHHSQIPEPGDYFVFEMDREAAILVRGDDAKIRALVNVCRHRGSRLCREKLGRTRQFVCPYHGWTYNLDGSLARAWDMPKDFDKDSYGLHRIGCEVFQGLIFINFGRGHANGAFNSARENLEESLRPFDLASTKVAHSEVCVIRGNWKLAVENYCECYHCAPAHPEYAASHSLKLPAARRIAIEQDLAGRAQAAGICVAPVGNLERARLEGEIEFYYDRYALFDGYVTGSEDGKPLAPLLGSLSEWDRGASNVELGRLTYLLIYSDHCVVYRFTPRAPQETDFEIVWLVRGDAEEGKDYDLERLIWLWHVTTLADKDIIERNQQGVNSSFYRPGPYAPMETFCNDFMAWYLDAVR